MLNTRPPTGKPPYPTILIEGDEKAGKSYISAVFTGSSKVGQAYWIDLGEGSADEYGPLGNYEVVIHDGTYGSIQQAVVDVKDLAIVAKELGEPPVVLVIDGINALWDSLKDWVTDRARRSKKNREILAKDPNAEIKAAPHLWNDANARWNRIINRLLTFPGVVIITAKGKEVAVMGPDGNPVQGVKGWRVQTQQELGYNVNAWIRMHRQAPAEVIGVRSIFPEIGFRPGTEDPKPLDADWSLEWFIFDALKVEPTETNVRDFHTVDASVNLPAGMTFVSAQDFLQRVADVWTDFDAIGALYREAVEREIADHEVMLPDGSAHILGEYIQARGVEMLEAAPQEPAETQKPAETPPEAERAPEPPPATDEADTAFTLQAELDDIVQAVKIAETPKMLRDLWNDSKAHLRSVVDSDGKLLGQLIVERQKALQTVGSNA